MTRDEHNRHVHACMASNYVQHLSILLTVCLHEYMRTNLARDGTSIRIILREKGATLRRSNHDWNERECKKLTKLPPPSTGELYKMVAITRELENKAEREQMKVEALSERKSNLQEQIGDLDAMEPEDGSGTIKLKIDQINCHLHTKTKVLCSQPFYLERIPYKVRIELHFDNPERGIISYLSLLLVIVKGDYDSVIQWPFSQKVTFKLTSFKGSDIALIGTPDSRTYHKPNLDSNIKFRCTPLSLTELKTAGVIKEDNIIVECQIHW